MKNHFITSVTATLLVWSSLAGSAESDGAGQQRLSSFDYSFDYDVKALLDLSDVPAPESVDAKANPPVSFELGAVNDPDIDPVVHGSLDEGPMHDPNLSFAASPDVGTATFSDSASLIDKELLWVDPASQKDEAKKEAARTGSLSGQTLIPESGTLGFVGVGLVVLGFIFHACSRRRTA